LQPRAPRGGRALFCFNLFVAPRPSTILRSGGIEHRCPVCSKLGLGSEQLCDKRGVAFLFYFVRERNIWRT
jgi:hypothetical protein